MTRGAVVVSVGVLLAGCSGGDGHVAGGEPITPAAIAAIVQDHVDLEPMRIAESEVLAPELGERSTAVWLEYADVSLTAVVAPNSESPWSAPSPRSSMSASPTPSTVTT